MRESCGPCTKVLLVLVGKSWWGWERGLPGWDRRFAVTGRDGGMSRGGMVRVDKITIVVTKDILMVIFS